MYFESLQICVFWIHSTIETDSSSHGILYVRFLAEHPQFPCVNSVRLKQDKEHKEGKEIRHYTCQYCTRVWYVRYRSETEYIHNHR
jgi:hypothetical protein